MNNILLLLLFIIIIIFYLTSKKENFEINLKPYVLYLSKNRNYSLFFDIKTNTLSFRNINPHHMIFYDYDYSSEKIPSNLKITQNDDIPLQFFSFDDDNINTKYVAIGNVTDSLKHDNIILNAIMDFVNKSYDFSVSFVKTSEYPYPSNTLFYKKSQNIVYFIHDEKIYYLTVNMDNNIPTINWTTDIKNAERIVN